MRSVHEILKDAKALIADPNDWTQGTAAQGTNYTAPYCSLGALYEAVGGYDVIRGEGYLSNSAARMAREVEYREAIVPLERAMGRNVATYNDNSPHKCVIAAFDAAIEQTK